MNLKDIKGDFKELYGGRILVDVVDSNEFLGSNYETYNNVIKINEKYYNYNEELKCTFDSLEDLYDEIEICKKNNRPRLIFINNMRKLLKDKTINEEYDIIDNIYNMIRDTYISIEMLFKIDFDIELIDDGNKIIWSLDDKLLSLVNNATGGEHQCHAIMFKSSYITVIKRYYTPSFDEEFIYVTTKNMSNRYNKIK